MDFETIATYIKVIQRLSSAEVISFLLRVTCVIFERAINTDVWQAMVARAIESQKKTFAPIVSVHRYCARKFTRHVIHERAR